MFYAKAQIDFGWQVVLSAPKNIVSQDHELSGEDQDVLGDTAMIFTSFVSYMPTVD